MSVRNPTIPGPDGEPPFEVGEELTIFEAAMVYQDRHPRPHWTKGFDPADPDQRAELERFFGLDRPGLRAEQRGGRLRSARGRRISRAVYRELIDAVSQDKIAHVRRDYGPDGAIDPFRTFIRRQDLTDLARRRHDGGAIVAGLIAEPIVPSLPPRIPPPSREKPFKAEVRIVAMAWLREHGAPARNDGHQAQLEQHLLAWAEDRRQQVGDPRAYAFSESTARRWAVAWIEEYVADPSAFQ